MSGLSATAWRRSWRERLLSAVESAGIELSWGAGVHYWIALVAVSLAGLAQCAGGLP